MKVDWEKFFDVIGEIVDSSGTFEEKKRTVVNAVRSAGEKAETDFDELLSWFDGELPP